MAQAQVKPKTNTQSADQHKMLRLKALVETAEKALAARDEDLAATRLEEADDFIADWSMELLNEDEVADILKRMNTIRRVLDGENGEPGIENLEDLTQLSPEDLRSELKLIESAEADTEFDFPIDLNDKVVAWVNAFTGRLKGFMEASLGRGEPYFPMILRILEEEGVPLDLAYLPIVESGFRNTARSRAAAVGMWQFIRPTGLSYGLRIDAWVDERRDPEKATRAAARFLKYLYGTFDDWYLALAGYNAGPGTVNKAINGTGSRNYWDHHRSRFLRNETKGYVPQMCAAVLVGKHPERFGLEIPRSEPYAYEILKINKSLGLNTLARRAGLDPGALKDLNPELIRATTPPRPYELKLPLGSSEAVEEALAAIPAAERLELRNYNIVKGDTLAKVAARYKTTPDDLLDYNNMTRNQFRAGRTIKVPVVVNLNAPTPKPVQKPATVKK